MQLRLNRLLQQEQGLGTAAVQEMWNAAAQQEQEVGIAAAQQEKEMGNAAAQQELELKSAGLPTGDLTRLIATWAAEALGCWTMEKNIGGSRFLLEKNQIGKLSRAEAGRRLAGWWLADSGTGAGRRRAGWRASDWETS